MAFLKVYDAVPVSSFRVAAIAVSAEVYWATTDAARTLANPASDAESIP